MTSRAIGLGVGETVVARELARSAKGELARWIAEDLGPWQWFVTLTYDPVKVLRARGVEVARASEATGSVRVGLQKMRRDVDAFVVDAARGMSAVVDAVVGIEPHETGSLHAHGLVRARRAVEDGDVRALHAAWYARHGFVKVEAAGSVARVAEYVTKFQRVAAYATKGQGDVLFSRRLLR